MTMKIYNGDKGTPVLFFDEQGCGPSAVAVSVCNLEGVVITRDGKPHRETDDNLGLNVIPYDGPGALIYDRAILGGFMLHRKDALELWKAMGAWLEEHPER